MYNFDEIIDRENTQSVKFDLLPEGVAENSLSMWIADMDFKAPQEVIDAMIERVEHGVFGYTYYDNDDLMKETIKWYVENYDWKINREDLFYSPGIVPAICAIIQILSKPGDGIIIQEPVYHPFRRQTEGNQRKIVRNPLIKKNGEYFIDFEGLEEKFKDPSNKILLFCNPHNPIGKAWSKEEIKTLVDLAKKYEIIIVSDEIHGDLTLPGTKYNPFMNFAEEIKERVIICTAPSKTFNIAGLQMSHIVIHSDEIKEAWGNKMCDENSISAPNNLAVTGTIAAYKYGRKWLDELMEYIDGNFKYLDNYLKENHPKVKLTANNSTYLAWVDFNGITENYDQFEEELLKEGLAFNSGSIFGKEGEGYQRINLASSRKIVEKMCLRLTNVIEKF